MQGHKGASRLKRAPGPVSTTPSTSRAKRKDGVPLYYQVMRDLKEQILSGKLRPGDRLPSEIAFTQTFHVSRVVIRQALQILESEELILRVKGRGTFVSEKVSEDAAPRITGSLDDLISMGPEVSMKVIEFQLVQATPDLAEVLGIAENTDLFYVQRLRLVHGQPLAVMVNHLPYHIGAQIPINELTKQPLIRLIETRAGFPVEWASQVFQAVAADQEMARLLEVDMLTPLLKLTLTAYADHGEVVDLAHVFYRSDRYNHHGYLVRDRKEGRPFWQAWQAPPTAPVGVDATAIRIV